MRKLLWSVLAVGALLLSPSTRAHAQSTGLEQRQPAWVDDVASESQLAAMDAALSGLQDESSVSGWDTVAELVMSTVYGGVGVTAMLEKNPGRSTVVAASFMLMFAGIHLGHAGYLLAGLSTSAADRYARFRALRQRGPVSKRALLVFEGELYAQALSCSHTRPVGQAAGVGWMLAGVVGFSLSFAALDGDERVWGALMGGAVIADGLIALIGSLSESSVERRWRAYHESQIQPRLTVASRLRVAPYASTLGAGLMLSVRL